MPNVKIRRFDMTRVSGDKVVVMIGRRGTGKSSLVRDLLYFHRNCPAATVISPTERANRFYSNIIPPVLIYDDYKPDIIEKFVRRQEKVMKQYNKDLELFRTTNIDPRAVMILDDCMYDSSWLKDKNIRMLFTNGRHYKVLFLITMQFPLGMPPMLRLQVDFVFLLRDNNIQNRRKTYESFAGMIPTFDMFCQIMDQCTENYECLVLDISNTTSNNFADQIYFYKAEPRRDFRMCDQEFWDRSVECAAGSQEEDDDEDEMQELPALARKKNAPQVNVIKKYY